MFKRARLKLTAWYVLIIFLITTLFSLAFYQLSTREIRRFANRLYTAQFRGQGLNQNSPLIPPHAQSLEALQLAKARLLQQLSIVDGIILFLAGGAAYFLAGKTLWPIKVMLDEQRGFIANSSHELRTPLANLRAELEASLLEKKLTHQQARTLIKSNLEEVARLQALSTQLLSLTQLHHPRSLVNSKQTVELKQIINSATKKVKALAKKKKIRLQLKSGQLEQVKISGDKGKLQELLVILLENAIKYSPSKSKIQLKTTLEKTKGQARVKISILDQGMGIAKEDLPHLFERFYRADKSRSQTEGFGLGLAIAQKIAHQHQGKIEVRSQEGQGSTFIVSLPITRG